MRRLSCQFFLLLLLSLVPAVSLSASECRSCLAQNIFDEDSAGESETAEKPVVSEEAPKPKVSSKAKKKKKARRRKSAPASATTTESQDYSAQELARQSYNWAPESSWQMKSSAPGLNTGKDAPSNKPAAVVVPETQETPPPPRGFKLPQIPLTQVLIVAGFVILFLIYRFRVGRQMKRRKY